MVNKDFLKAVFMEEKGLLKLSEVKFKNVPFYDELAVKKIWPDVQKDPEVIAVLPCGFDLKRTREEMRPLTTRPGWSKLQAVNKGRVYLTDGNQYFNRPGPRTVEALEMLAEFLHPDEFNFGHHKIGWDYL